MLAIRDCMRSIPNDVVTVNLEMAYSAGQFLLSSGTRGKRYALAHAKVLLHQGSAGIGGTAMDIAIQAEDLRSARHAPSARLAVHARRARATAAPVEAARAPAHPRVRAPAHPRVRAPETARRCPSGEQSGPERAAARRSPMAQALRTPRVAPTTTPATHNLTSRLDLRSDGVLFIAAACVPAFAVLAAAVLLGRRRTVLPSVAALLDTPAGAHRAAHPAARPEARHRVREEDRVRPAVSDSGEKIWVDENEVMWHEIVSWSGPDTAYTIPMVLDA
jgi:hypothetical protein